MPNISVKDVPEAWAEALRQRAARNHRSLQGELMAIIEKAALEPSPAAYDKGNAVVRQGWKSIEQIAAEQRARGLTPFRGGPSSVDLIREDRDTR